MEDNITFEDRYYHEFEQQKTCPNCMSDKVACVSRIDKTKKYGDVYYKYHCNNCGRDGREIPNSVPSAWNVFKLYGEQPS